MAKTIKKYSNEDITVVWQPDVCIHSKLCWTELLPVFDPRRRPWIDMDAADTNRIVQQVERCPSGALSFHRNTENPPSDTTKDIENGAV